MTRPTLICITIFLAAIALGMIAGCQHQPMGEDLWLTVP